MPVQRTGVTGFLVGSGRTNSVIPAPSQITDGNILVLYLLIGGGVTPTPPAGFAGISGTSNGLIYTIANFPGTANVHVWWKRASGESGDYTITHALSETEGACSCYSGNVTSGDPTNSPSPVLNSGVDGTNIVASSITPVSDGSMVIMLFSCYGGYTGTYYPPPTGTTPVFYGEMNTEDAYSGALFVYSGTLIARGATGNKSPNNPTATGTDWNSCMFSIKGASQQTTLRKA